MQDPRSGFVDLGSWMQDSGSLLLDPGYWMLDPGYPGSRIHEPGFGIRIQDARSRNPESRILPGSSIPDAGSQMLDPGSCNLVVRPMHVPAALRRPQKKKSSLELRSMYLIHFVVFCYFFIHFT